MKLEIQEMTDVYQSGHGWCAETKYKLGERTIRVFTMKRYNGAIVTDIQVGKTTHGGGFRYDPNLDYRVVGATAVTSATSGKIKAQHEEVLRDVERHLGAIERHYAGK